MKYAKIKEVAKAIVEAEGDKKERKDRAIKLLEIMKSEIESEILQDLINDKSTMMNIAIKSIIKLEK